MTLGIIKCFNKKKLLNLIKKINFYIFNYILLISGYEFNNLVAK